MSVDAFDPDVRRFIVGSIASVPHLEALLLLRAEPALPWSCAAVAARLYMQEAATAGLLADLAAQGLLACDGSETRLYRYAPVTAELARVVQLLAHAYSTRLIEVTHLIHSRVERGAHHFADAFRWRRE